MATPAPIAPSTIDRSPLVNGASVPEPSFAYTDLRGIGRVDIDDLLDYVHESAREFPSYLRLYEKYLKQRWDVTELDFATDVRDWNERMSEEERETFLKVASGFHHGERQVTVQFQFIRLGDFPLFKSNEDKGGYRTMALPAWQDQLLIYFASLTPADQVYAGIVQDKRFRQAVSMAIDRTEVKKSVFLDFGREAQYAPPKGSDVWEQYMDDSYVQYDVEAANALLDEMGLAWDDKHKYRLMPDGRRLAIPFTYYEVTPTATPGAELFPEFMKPIGIDTQIKQVDGRLYWSQNQAAEIHFADWWLPVQYMHIYGPAFFSVTAFGWNNWIATNGEAGTEPPDEVKRLYELKEIMQSTGDPAERQAAHKEIWESQAENIWVIGTVAAAPVPFVYNINLGNIGIAEEMGYYSVVVGDAAEQWYWKN